MLTRYTFELEAVFVAKMQENEKKHNIQTLWTPFWISIKTNFINIQHSNDYQILQK